LPKPRPAASSNARGAHFFDPDTTKELARQIRQLAAVVVIWTAISSASKTVRDAARLVFGIHHARI